MAATYFYLTERPLSAHRVDMVTPGPNRTFNSIETDGSPEAGGTSLDKGQGLPLNLCLWFRDVR